MHMRNILLFCFMLLLTISSALADTSTTSGIVAYINSDGVKVPIPNVNIDIYRSDGSFAFLTTSNNVGYYTYTINEGTYYISITESGYISRTFLETYASNRTGVYILLEPDTAPNYIMPHFVAFDVRNFLGTTHYANVEVEVYENNTIKTNGFTGNDGVFGAMLSEDRKYTITFTNVTQNIDREWTGYPIDSRYDIIVFNAGFKPEERPVDDILYGITSSSANATKGFINVTYNDTSSTTIRAKLYINDTNNNPLYYQSSTNPTGNFSQLVDGVNNTYVVTFWIDNTQLDNPLMVTKIISLENEPKIDLGWDENWHYIVTTVLIIIGIVALFTTRNAEVGAIIGVLAGWFFLWIGWSVMGMSVAQVTTVGLMLLLGTVIAFGAYIRGEY